MTIDRVLTLVSDDGETPLLAAADLNPSHYSHIEANVEASPAYTDWLGRPIDVVGKALGGWKCSSCLVGAYGLGSLATSGIFANLVVFLVREWGCSNAAAASTVSNLTGTIFLSAFLTASLTDAYIGRLWTSLFFQIIIVLCLASASCIVWGLLSGLSTAGMRITLMVLLYMFSIIMGPILPSITTLGGDQLLSSEQKEMYFKLLSIANTLGQLLATTVVTYVDEAGMWVAGFCICTVVAGIGAALTWIVAPQCRAYKTSGNPLVQIAQVFVAAWRRRSLPVSDETLLLGSPSLIPCSHKFSHLSTLSFLDKAAVLSPIEPKLNELKPWHMCTVKQVEELKCLLRIIPVGISFTLLTATSALVTTLFEEQALVMERQVTSWLVIPPASLNLFAIAGSLFIGISNTLGGAQCIGLLFGCSRRRRPSPLHMQGVGLLLCILAMAIAALVESQRLNVVAQDGTTFSILWLIPQTFLVGASMHINLASSFDFFYSEASDGMRMTSNCILSLFHGFGNYLASLLVTLVTAITTRGGQKGWISSDLNEGHLDYFYWLYASILGITMCIHLAYASFYTRTKKSLTTYYTIS